MKAPKVPVAKEGYPFILFSAFATLILTLIGCSWVAYLGLALTGFILMFFRDPERFIPDDEHAVVSPADGKVLNVDLIDDDNYLNGKAYKIVIFMNVFNVHVNRAPFSGIVQEIKHAPGKFYAADSEKALLHNENCATIIESETYGRIAFVQIAGLIARRIVNWFERGDMAIKGQRFGLIRFGSRVDVYLPANCIIGVKVGQKIRAGESILAYLSPENG